jgi:hypothetical protein
MKSPSSHPLLSLIQTLSRIIQFVNDLNPQPNILKWMSGVLKKPLHPKYSTALS